MLPILGWEGELGCRTFLHDRGETEGGVLTAHLQNPGSYPSIFHNLRLAPDLFPVIVDFFCFLQRHMGKHFRFLVWRILIKIF